MIHRAAYLFSFLLSAILTCAVIQPLNAQDESAALAQPHLLDPSDLYFEAWMKIRDAEKLSAEEKHLDSYEKYLSAQKLFGTISSYHPDWNSKMVSSRIGTTQKAIDEVQPKAAAEERAKQQKIEALYIEGGSIDAVPDPSGLIQPDKIIPVIPSNPPVKSPNKKAPAKLPSAPRADKPSATVKNDNSESLRLHREIDALRKQLRIAERDRNANAAKLRKSINRLEVERSLHASNTVNNELQRLNTKLKRVEEERDAMAVALKKSRREQREKATELEKVRADAQLAKKEQKNIEQKLQLERQTNNQLVDGLRRQLKTLQSELQSKDHKIAELNTTVTNLQTELTQSHETISELKIEREALIQERFQLTELLKLNDSDRVQALIEQKVKLASQLRELREGVEILRKSDNATKDQLLEERQKVAMVKKQMIDLQSENQDQSKRLTDLTQRLQEARTELETQPLEISGATDEAEALMLKDIIKRQLAVQERQKIYKTILFERAAELNVSDELRAPIENLLSENLSLSDEEKELIENAPVADGEFFNPGAAPKSVRKLAGARLQEKISSSKRVATRAYAAKRYQACREVLEMILEDAPGDISTLCNLGVVNVAAGDLTKAEQCFRDAITMEEKTAFAHYGLGALYYQQKRDSEATPALQRTLELQPEKAEAHVFLGNISAKYSDLSSAENHFRSAIRINPTLREPTFNLAAIKAQTGQFEEARKFYQQALENGALPDKELERLLNK